MFKYLKYMVTPFLMSTVTAGILMGGVWMWAALAFLVVVIVGGDALSGDDLSEPSFRRVWILNLVLYMTFPVLLCLLFALAWMSGSGLHDFAGFGSFVLHNTGYDLFTARDTTNAFHLTGAVLASGLAVSGYGTNVAHELTHRTSDRTAMLVGRWLLGMSCNADFSIEHVYGHHVNVATTKDPASAYRGENVYHFILRSTLTGHVSAWHLEKRRLQRKGYSLFSPRNLMIRGYLISLSYAAVFYAAAGPAGLAVFFAQAFWAKAILEIVNYMEHYGLVRVPGQSVLPRHSWNTNKFVSSVVLYSLTRHSAHHEKGDLAYWKLKPCESAPTMPFGYLTTILICLVPPLWNRLMEPRLRDWDARFASSAEKKLLNSLLREKRGRWNFSSAAA